MSKQLEGVIKFNLRFTQSAPIFFAALHEINAWRKIFYLTRLIGQEAGRYGGFGYGNISRRIEPFDAPEHRKRFVISGTQTGKLEHLTEDHYAVVTESYPEENLIVSEGPIQPSSETLTHAAVYEIDSSIRCVIHVHSPEIWQHAKSLGIPITRKEVAYGTPEMAKEVQRLFQYSDVKNTNTFAMGGHEDGIVSFGETIERAGMGLLHYLALAFQVS